jgi:hypothetical protein
MLNFCGIVVAILKLETGRNFSMSGINSGHFQNDRHNTAQIQHCQISTTFHMWIDYGVPNQFGTSLSTHISNFDDIGQC